MTDKKLNIVMNTGIFFNSDYEVFDECKKCGGAAFYEDLLNNKFNHSGIPICYPCFEKLSSNDKKEFLLEHQPKLLEDFS